MKEQRNLLIQKCWLPYLLKPVTQVLSQIQKNSKYIQIKNLRVAQYTKLNWGLSNVSNDKSFSVREIGVNMLIIMKFQNVK